MTDNNGIIKICPSVSNAVGKLDIIQLALSSPASLYKQVLIQYWPCAMGGLLEAVAGGGGHVTNTVPCHRGQRLSWRLEVAGTCRQYCPMSPVSPLSQPMENCPQPGHCGPIRGQESQPGGGWRNWGEERGQVGQGDTLALWLTLCPVLIGSARPVRTFSVRYKQEGRQAGYCPPIWVPYLSFNGHKKQNECHNHKTTKKAWSWTKLNTNSCQMKFLW